jgi:hypothetical protein
MNIIKAMKQQNQRNFKSGKADGINGRQCVQQRLAFSVGVSPTGAGVRSPVAWIARVEETKLVKPIDKAIERDGERVTGPQRK